MSAFAPEWGVLQEMIEDRTDAVENGVRFVTGTIDGTPVVLLLSGVGMVNAAMSAQMVLDRYTVDTIVFSGIAGGVDPSLTLGEVVVPDRWASYFNVLIARKTTDGYSIPSFMHAEYPNYGMLYPQPELVRSDGHEEPEHRFWFEVDEGLLTRATRASVKVALESCTGAGVCLSEAPRVVVGGNGVSGSAFVDNAEFRKYVFDTFDASVVDMESAAVAQVAATNGVKFIAFRSLSDLAGGSEAENEMETFMAIAAENSAGMVRAFLAEGAEAGQP
ncbi:phosphorylase [Acuticoccus sediminis]|uniref:Phosphorylase n=2 Tax=Acuticoccus sediminis TaxID=2184697 RepID=A0A8B2NQP5_9HYPH|nr:phosphorylase [Acuticoccus sediminis]